MGLFFGNKPGISQLSQLSIFSGFLMCEDTGRQFDWLQRCYGETNKECVFRRADPRHVIIHKTTECGWGKEPKWCSDLVKESGLLIC